VEIFACPVIFLIAAHIELVLFDSNGEFLRRKTGNGKGDGDEITALISGIGAFDIIGRIAIIGGFGDTRQ